MNVIKYVGLANPAPPSTNKKKAKMALKDLAEEFEGDFTLIQIETLWKLYVPVPKDPKNQISEEEFRFFLERCISSDLDPFQRQIGIVKRGGKVSIDANIGGLRAIAERSGLYAGTTPSYWCGEDGEWKEIWLKKWGYPAAAKIGIFKRGSAEPFWGSAMWDEFVQGYNGKPGDIWARMPAHMLCKVAEAIALKRAFPSGSKTQTQVIDTSYDGAIASSYRPQLPSSIPVMNVWEERFRSFASITGCPYPTIQALCSRWLGCSVSHLDEESARKLRSLVAVQWAGTIHKLTEKESAALLKLFWKPEYAITDDQTFFLGWKQFVERKKQEFDAEAIEVPVNS